MWAKNIENGSIPVHWSNNIGNMSFEPKNIDISVENMSKPSKIIIWPSSVKLRLASILVITPTPTHPPPPEGKVVI